MEILNQFWVWFCSWQSDAVITTWVKANAILSAVIVVGIRTVAGMTKTTIDNEFLEKLKERFGVGK